MSEHVITRHCAPTLAGLKTGNLFTVSYRSAKKLYRDIARMNRILGKKGLRIAQLRLRGGRALIYVYRPKKLAEDLEQVDAKAILAGLGYDEDTNVEDCIRKLSHRIRKSSEFPHEIGLFLGYPPEDVRGFIRWGGRDCKACGYWKVYGDVDSAEKLFRRYEKCTCVYMKCLKRGKSFEELIVQS